MKNLIVLLITVSNICYSYSQVPEGIDTFILKNMNSEGCSIDLNLDGIIDLNIYNKSNQLVILFNGTCQLQSTNDFNGIFKDSIIMIFQNPYGVIVDSNFFVGDLNLIFTLDIDNYPYSFKGYLKLGISYTTISEYMIYGWGIFLCQNHNFNNLINFHQLSIFPNPAEDYVKLAIGFERCANLSVKIVDITGRVLETRHAGSTIAEEIYFDLFDLAEGIYFVQIVVNNQIVTKHFMIVR